MNNVNLKYYFSIVLLMILCVASISCSIQKEGYVITNTNDTIRGNFKLLMKPPIYHVSAPIQIFTVYKNKNIKVDIKAGDIKNIDVIDKKKKDTSTYIFFHDDFWRQLAANDNLGIYVRNFMAHIGSWYRNEDYAEYEDVIILPDKERKIQIYVYSGVQDDYNFIAQQVLQFINTRYSLNFTHDELVNNYFIQGVDFEKQKKLFEFILDKEIELENNSKNQVK